MKHLVLVYYILTFASGFASFCLLFLGYLKDRDRKIVVYSVFLAVLTMLVAVNAYQFYRYNIAAYGTGYASFWVNFAMSVIFGALVFLAPILTFTLAGSKTPRTIHVITIVLSSLSVVFPLSFRVMFHDNAVMMDTLVSWLYGFYTWLFFAIVAAGVVFLAVKLPKTGDPERKRMIVTVIVLCAVFFPGFLMDANWRYFQLEKKYLPLGFNFTPLFYLFVNLATILFSVRFLTGKTGDGLKPIDVPGVQVTDIFINRFNITPQEKTVISMALDGMGNSRIAEKLFISPGTVKNHMHNIYEKTGAKNRIGLANLIKNTK